MRRSLVWSIPIVLAAGCVLSCPSYSIDQFCADHGGDCARAWSDLPLSQPSAWSCMHDSISTSCAGYEVYSAGSDDTGDTLSYFDGKSGKLVAIVQDSGKGERCIVGPAFFSPPQCTFTKLGCQTSP